MKVIFVTTIMLLLLPIVALADTQLPVQNGVITSGVGWRLDPFGSGRAILHHGIDIAVPVGTLFVPPARVRLSFPAYVADMDRPL